MLGKLRLCTNTQLILAKAPFTPRRARCEQFYFTIQIVARIARNTLKIIRINEQTKYKKTTLTYLFIIYAGCLYLYFVFAIPC